MPNHFNISEIINYLNKYSNISYISNQTQLYSVGIIVNKILLLNDITQTRKRKLISLT